MRRLLLGLTLLLLLAAVALVAVARLGRERLPAIELTHGAVSAAPGTYAVALSHDGRERRYLLHVPPAAAAGTALPLVIVLHGGGGDALHTDGLTGFRGLADREGFLVAFPDGIDHHWNDGRRDVRSNRGAGGHR